MAVVDLIAAHVDALLMWPSERFSPLLVRPSSAFAKAAKVFRICRPALIVIGGVSPPRVSYTYTVPGQDITLFLSTAAVPPLLKVFAPRRPTPPAASPAAPRG